MAWEAELLSEMGNLSEWRGHGGVKSALDSFSNIFLQKIERLTVRKMGGLSSYRFKKLQRQANIFKDYNPLP